MKGKRRFGVLMHLTSLPSPDGIGTLGQSAYDFVNFLERSGASIWQMLPVGPVGGGESPYQSPSTFAGNPMLIDLTMLYHDGLLDIQPTPQPGGPVDYPSAKTYKRDMLKRAYDHSFARVAPQVEAFRQKNDWLDDYALFEALREHFELAPLIEWPDRAARMHEKEALTYYRMLLSERVHYHMFVQYLFDRQWEQLRFYAGMHGIKLFGDLPIYVAADSADVWSNPGLFKLDEEYRPLKISGVPPDYFSEDGQLWGNPIYHWKAHHKTGFDWWIRRMQGIARRFDMVRIDHFIGFVNYYSVPYGAPNARNGKWRNGPGELLFKAVLPHVDDLEIVAEDLGVVNLRVVALRKRLKFPGMKVLEFAFDGGEKNPHLPANYKKNCVAYTGTHDNDTALGWYSQATPKARKMAEREIGLKPEGDIAWQLIEAVMMSRANTCVVPMQDLLGLASDARMNTPGTATGNWRWRMDEGATGGDLAERLRLLAERSERTRKMQSPPKSQQPPTIGKEFDT